MSILRNSRNRLISHKLKRSIAFNGWRRHISGKEKIFAKESKNFDLLKITG